MSTTVLTVNGTAVPRTGGVILNQLRLSLDEPDELAFTQFAHGMPGSFAPEQPVTLTINGVLVFTGNIFSRGLAGYTRGVGNVGYRALGLKYQGYLIPVTAADGTGQFIYNRPSTDPLYVASQSGLSIGTILANVFGIMSAQMAAVGITSWSSPDLAALTVVPPEPVFLTGNSFWTQIDGLLQTWYGSRYASYITPSGTIRIIDTTLLSAQTLTFGTDPIVFGGLTEDTSECYTQVILRGRDDVEPAYLSLHDGTLIDPHDSAGDNLEATWTMADFLYPKNAYDQGSISAVTSTQVTCTSDDGTWTTTTNYWATLQAQIAVINPASLTISFTEYRRITADTSESAGGSFIVTMDHPLSNSGYTRYQIRGTSDAASGVYRRLNIKPTFVAQHLVQTFNYSVRWSPSQGAVVLTNNPVGVVCWTESTGAGSAPFQTPIAFEVAPYDGVNDGYILCFQPWVSYFNTSDNLLAGGASVVQATDIQILVPYSRGTLTAQYPASGYGGTAYTRFGIQRTLYRDYPTWFDASSSASMSILAQQVHATVANVVQEGSVTYLGLYSTALNNHVLGQPIALNIANEIGVTSFEGMGAPVREIILDMPQEEGSIGWITRLRCSTRRQQFSADRLYVHPSYQQGGSMGNFGVSGAGPQMGSTTIPETGTIFTPSPQGVYSAREMQALGAATERERIAQIEMGAKERDDRPAAALNAAQSREDRAAAAIEKAENAPEGFAQKAAKEQPLKVSSLGPSGQATQQQEQPTEHKGSDATPMRRPPSASEGDTSDPGAV